MKTTVNKHAFIDAFRAYDRYETFGYEGLNLLFDYLEQYEQDCGQEIELDVVAICCDYNMLNTDELVREYSIDVEGMDDDEKHDAVIDYLNENTSVVGECKDGIIFAVF